MPTSETRTQSGPTRRSAVGFVADTGLHEMRRKADGRASVEPVARESESGEVKAILAVVALVGVAWWLQRQIAISRRDEPTTLDLLKAAIKRNAA